MIEELRIVIVDGDHTGRSHLQESLTRLGYLVVGAAEDGTDGLYMTRQLRPDMVLADTNIHGMNGIDLAQLLRHERLAPVILMTSQSTREITDQAIQAGVHGYLFKPVQESELRPAIEVVRAQWELFCTRQQEIHTLREQLDTRNIIERAKGYLMDEQGLREREAFRKMQKLAMNHRKTMKEVAQAILLANQVSL